MLAEDNMSGLLSAENEAVLQHVLIDILVSYCRLLIFHSDLITCLVEAKVGHNGRHDRIARKTSLLHKIFSADIHNAVAVHNIAVLIHCDTSVRISVIGESHIQLLLFHKLLEHFNVSGTAVRVDVRSVRFIVDDIGLCSKCIEYALRDRKRASVCTVKTDPHILEGTGRQ